MQDIYTKILKIIKSKEDFEFEAYRFPMLVRRIDNRIIQTDQQTPEEYIKYLVDNSEEPKKLLNNFLINVSHFYRNSLMFEYLKAKVIPELISQIKATGQNSIRIWSAGCSRGEEPYTLAILLHEYCKKEAPNICINFFATDYDEKAIIQARKGVYDYESIKEMKIKYLDKYFTKSGNKYEISSEIKSMVKFATYNILDKNSYVPSESIFGNFDVVMCRNLLIYFNEDYQNFIFEKLYKSLSPNKILVLGEAEIPMKEFKDKFQRINSCCNIYTKK